MNFHSNKSVHDDNYDLRRDQPLLLACLPRVGARAREDSDNVEPVKRELEQPVRSAINGGYWIYKQLLRTSVMSVRRCRNIYVRLLLSSYPSVESAALQSATYRHVTNSVEISLKRRNGKERRFLATKSPKITNLTTRLIPSHSNEGYLYSRCCKK